MYYSELVIKGLLIGFGVSAPIGPIGILCINRSIKKGFLSGVFTGMGAVVPNIIYTFLAVYGVVSLIRPMIENYPWLTVISGLYVLFLGIKSFQKGESTSTQNLGAKDYWRDFISTFLIMITNPATIISFIIVLSGVGLKSLDDSGSFEILLITGSVISGAMLWWIFLSLFSVKIGLKFFLDKIPLLNKISGSVIVTFGILIIIKSIL